MYFKFFLMACLSLALFTGCSNDDDFDDDEGIENPDDGNDPGDGGPEDDQGPYAEGFFVVNEGSQTAGTISFISSDYQTVEQDLFTANNPDANDLGKFVQSMFFDDSGRAYIISNGSNLITVVDRNTFELIGKVDSGLNIPRYGVVENGKIYVTNQADFSTGDDDFIAVIDTSSFEIQETINIGAKVENIEDDNGMLYIQNAAFGSGNQISVFDPMSNQVTETISTADGLNSIEVEDGTIYALSNDTLQKIDLSSLNVTDQVAFNYTDDSGNDLAAKNLDIEDGMVYYTAGKSVYAIDISFSAPAQNPIVSYDNSDFGGIYGFEVENNTIYIADSGNFQTNSYIKINDLNGNELETIDVGVGPNGFYFGD